MLLRQTSTTERHQRAPWFSFIIVIRDIADAPASSSPSSSSHLLSYYHSFIHASPLIGMNSACVLVSNAMFTQVRSFPRPNRDSLVVRVSSHPSTRNSLALTLFRYRHDRGMAGATHLITPKLFQGDITVCIPHVVLGFFFLHRFHFSLSF